MHSKKLCKSDPVPLYMQLALLIEREIAQGWLAHGSALPTERELCLDYDISRVTVREAISVLKRKKLVETRRGSGNYVVHQEAVSRDLLGVHDFDLQIAASGHTNQIDLLNFDNDHRSTHVASILALSPDAPLIKVVRLRKADDIPLFIETIFLAHEKFPGLTSADFLSTDVFSKKVREDYGIEIAEITLELDPVILRPEQAEALHVADQPAAGLMNERTSFDTEGRPVVFSQWLFSRHRCRHLLKIKAK